MQTVQTEGDAVSAAAGYIDSAGARHHRQVTLTPTGLTCVDTLSGFFREAELRWRLFPSDWVLEGNTCGAKGGYDRQYRGRCRCACFGNNPRVALLPTPGAGASAVGDPTQSWPDHIENQFLIMHVLYFHQHFSTPQGSAGTRSYEMAQALLREGHSVTMVCGSYAQGNTGLSKPFEKGKRRGAVDGIDVIEFDLNYDNHMGFVQRLGVFLKFALGSVGVALREPTDVVFSRRQPHSRQEYRVLSRAG